jgi:hypothetical protein
MATIAGYLHHKNYVYVREDLKGRHRGHCLCWRCGSFFPDDREKNCKIANMVFALDRALKLVTPVWECPDFREKEERKDEETA